MKDAWKSPHTSFLALGSPNLHGGVFSGSVLNFYLPNRQGWTVCSVVWQTLTE
jgi:hypothetical protein